MKDNLYSVLQRFVTNRLVIKAVTFFFFSFFLSHQIFSQAPAITSFAPTSAAKGNTIVITGTNFTGTSAVSLGGVAASSFTVVSASKITAIVPLAASGSVNVTNAGQTAVKTGFYYLSLSGIITDFEGFWSTTTVNNNPTVPNDSHNLLAFTYNGVNYSTGVNNNALTGQGISYTPGDFRSLPVANITGTNSSANLYLAMASKVDGNAAVANAAAVANITAKDVMTDGVNGLNMGTGVTNLPASATMAFEVHVINAAKITDAEPDILITQIADPSSGNDVFQFVDVNGAIIGNTITQDMTLLTMLGTYSLDLFDLSPGAPFNSAMGFSASSTNTTRNIRLAAFKLSDFGITMSNYMQVAALKITPSGTSDYAFIAFNANAIEMSPNLYPYVERTNSSICAGGTANLEVIATAAYGGSLSFKWQESADGGVSWSPVSNGGNYSGATTKRLSIVSAINNYKYKVTVTESGTGFSATCSPFTIAVITPVAPTAVSVSSTTTTCLNSLVSLSGAVTGGSNLFYEWQTNASGSYIAVPDAIIKTYLPPVNVAGVISYRLKVSSGSGCSGAITSSPVVITVVGISSVTPASRCGTGLVSLGATATSGTISWYAASTGGTALATGTNYAPSISASTTYYVATDAAQCATGGRVPVSATINSVVWAGTNTIDWSTLANWDCGGVSPGAIPGALNNVTIPTAPSGGRFPTISTTAPINNITISPGASITVASDGIFEIYGTISNNDGTFNATSGTISMMGGSQQTIPANAFSTNTIKNLVINNSAGVLLGGPLNLTGTYTPTAGLLTTFGYLTLKSNASGTARVAAGSGTYIMGNVNVERYMPARRSWRLMTAPLTNSNTIYESWQNGGIYAPGKGMLVTAPGGGTGIDSSGNASLKIWSRTSQGLQTIFNTRVPLSASNNGAADNTGYFVFVRGDRDPVNIDPGLIRKNITVLTSTGYLQTGTQNFTGLSGVAGGFTLIGNPYASPIDLNLLLANSGTSNIKRKFYIWDPQLNSVGGYVVLDDVLNPGTFRPTPVTSSQGNHIQSGQAFFIITNTAGAATLEIKESNKTVTNNTQIFGRPLGNTQSLITNLYLLNADGTTVSADGTRADFNPAFIEGIDDADNLKYTNTNETFGLLRNGIFLATERRPSLTRRDTLFFKLSRSAQAGYQFQFIPEDFSDAGITAMLEDSYTGIPVQLDLSAPTKVNFVINSDPGSQAQDRFRVVFMSSTVLPVTFSSLTAHRRQEDIDIVWKVENELNIIKYEVERSGDGIGFHKINTITAGSNNLSTAKYNCVDADGLKGYNYYRIKSVGLNGKISYSQVVKVWMGQNIPAVNVYPNPVINKVMNVRFDDQPAGGYTLKITNSIGQLIMEKKLNHAGGSTIKPVALPGSIEPGNYELIIIGSNLKKTSIKIIVP